MTNKRRYIFAAIALSMLLSLCGCSLAKPDLGRDAEEDRLIGFFITRTSLDLFDHDRYVNDNLSSFTKNGFIDGNTDTSKYQGRLYAEYREGTFPGSNELEFPGVEGYKFFIAEFTDSTGVYTGSVLSDGICNSSFHAGNNTSIEGTIYISTAALRPFFANPVYQSNDGSIYVVSGTGMSSVGMSTPGAAMSQTMSTESSVTENGETIEKSFRAEIHYEVMAAPEKLTLIQMDWQSNVLRRDEYIPNDMPDSLELHPECEYVLTETCAPHPDSPDNVVRTLLSRGEISLITFWLPAGTDVYFPVYTELVWTNSPARAV